MEIKDIIFSACKGLSTPVLCKNGMYADSKTGRKLLQEDALLGKVTFFPGGKQYVNQKLDKTIYLDFAWIEYGILCYRIIKADKINKTGLVWETVLATEFLYFSGTPVGDYSKEYVSCWLSATKDELFSHEATSFSKKLYELMKLEPSFSEEYDMRFIGLQALVKDSGTDAELKFDVWKKSHKTVFFFNSQRAKFRAVMNGDFSKVERKHSKEHYFRERKFGFELEFTGISRDFAAKVVARALDSTKEYKDDAYHTHTILDRESGKNWRIVKDGSIVPVLVDPVGRCNKENYKCELISPILEYKDLPKIGKILSLLTEAGALTNFSCGMHVHVDIDDYTPIMLRNLVNMTFSKEDMLLKALGVSNFRETEWCRKLDEDFLYEINELGRDFSFDNFKSCWYRKYSDERMHYNRTRYQLLNLHSYFEKKGAEFRLFNATLDYNEIRANIILSLAICSAAADKSKSVAFANGGLHTLRKSSTAKSDMSSWLYQLGFQGDEYKYLREYLKRNLNKHSKGAV